MSVISCLSLSLLLCPQSPAPDLDARVTGLVRARLATPAPTPAFSPLFVAREDAAPPSVFDPLPHEPDDTDAAVPEHKRRNRERLLRAWQLRPEPDALASAIAAAAAIPELTTGPSPSAAPWTAVGSGVFSNAPNQYHRTGRIACAAYAHDPAQGITTLYLGATGGGLWRYDWGVGRWRTVSHTLAGSPSVGAFVVDPRNARRIVIGSGDPWRFQGDGLYLSTDAGATWTRRALTPTPDSFYRLRADRSAAQSFLAASNTGIYRSDDFGSSWQRVHTAHATDLLQDPAYPNYWYAGAQGVGVLESSDGGRTFHPINGLPGTGLIANPQRITLALCDAAPNYVYAMASRNFTDIGGIWRSSNYGRSWTLIDDATVDPISWGGAFHTGAMAVDPRNPAVLMCAMAGFQMTTDATAANVSWIRRRQPGHADYTSITFIPDGWAPSRSFVLITSDGGYCTHDWAANSTFTDGNLRGLDTTQVLLATHGFKVAPDARRMLAGTQDNGVVQIDQARAPQEQMQYATGGDGGMVSFAAWSSATAFGSSGCCPFGREMSLQSGLINTWRGIDGNLAASDQPVVLSRLLSGFPLGFTNDNNGFVYLTPLLGGIQWMRLNAQPIPSGPFTFDLTSDLLSALCQGYDGHLHVVDVFGGGATRRTPPRPANATWNGATITADASPGRAAVVYYATASSTPPALFRSLDRGATWQNCTGNLAALGSGGRMLEFLALPSNARILIAATSLGVFRSEDAGASWFRWMDGLPQVVDVRDVEVNTRNGVEMVRIATNGRGFFERPAY